MQIQFTNTINAKDGVKSVIYGPSGVGKTRLIATAPRPFIFNAEKGLLSLRKFKIPYATVYTYKELMEAFTWATGSAEARNYDTFALDSLSEIAEVVAAEERRKNPDARKWSPAKDDSMYHLVRSFRDLKQKHVVCVCKQALIEQGQMPNIVKAAIPLMPGDKLQNNMPYFWDLVAHMFNEVWEGKQYDLLHCRADTLWHAKDRSGNLNNVEQGNLADIFAKVIA